MREQRRLKIAQRQLILAQIARREARFALATALAEEDRCTQVHDRAVALLREYEERISQADEETQSQTLQANLKFVRSLQTMADGAGGAQKDARDQSAWQMQALAKMQARLDAQEAKVDQAKRAFKQDRDRREISVELATMNNMARKLLKSGATRAEPASNRRN